MFVSSVECFFGEKTIILRQARVYLPVVACTEKSVRTHTDRQNSSASFQYSAHFSRCLCCHQSLLLAISLYFSPTIVFYLCLSIPTRILVHRLPINVPKNSNPAMSLICLTRFLGMNVSGRHCPLLWWAVKLQSHWLPGKESSLVCERKWWLGERDRILIRCFDN